VLLANVMQVTTAAYIGPQSFVEAAIFTKHPGKNIFIGVSALWGLYAFFRGTENLLLEVLPGDTVIQNVLYTVIGIVFLLAATIVAYTVVKWESLNAEAIERESAKDAAKFEMEKTRAEQEMTERNSSNKNVTINIQQPQPSETSRRKKRQDYNSSNSNNNGAPVPIGSANTSVGAFPIDF